MRKIRFSLFAVAVLIGTICFDSSPAFAQQQLTISRSISSSGTTLLRLSGGYFNGCIVLDSSTVSVASNNILITSAFHGLPCFVPPPGFFDVTIDVGFLPIGHYNVNWVLGAPYGSPLASTQFDVTDAPLPQAIPTTGMVPLLIPAFAIAFLGGLLARRHHFAA